MTTEIYGFGPFQAVPSQRVLLRQGKPVRLGSRAFDILIALVERAGEMVARDELVARVWPDTRVDEGALRVHLAALRKVLGESEDGRGFIANVRGEGYRFDAPVTVSDSGAPAPAAPTADAVPAAPAPSPAIPANGNLPALLTPTIGRDGIIAMLAGELQRRRLLTIVGPGGIGKTTVALAAARAAQQDYQHGVWLVELGALPAPDLVPTAIATALGTTVRGGSGADLVAWLRHRQTLILLDCCEHVIDAVAELAETLLHAAPGLRIIATSREPLRAEGEWLHRLASLALPPERRELTVQEALRYPAIQLFDERARAAGQGFALADADVPAVLEICQRLDGVPLAMELAAARLDAFSIQDLAARLDRRFAVLTNGHRTALPRQQTLRATMDWSYGLLSETEKLVLQRLGAFTCDFTLAAAIAVAADARISPLAVTQCIGDLVEKSLVATDFSDGRSFYRLLDTTRYYVLEKLAGSGETGRIMRRLIDCVRELFGGTRTSSAMDLKALHRQIGNLRLALEWAFSPEGDIDAGVALAAEAMDFWLVSALLNECSEWATKALARATSAGDRRQEMILRCGRGLAQLFARGMQAVVQADLGQGLKLAQQLDDAEYQRRAIYGLWAFAIRSADLTAAHALAESYNDIGRQAVGTVDQAVARWMLGMTEAHIGRHDDAGELLHRAIEHYPAAAPHGHIQRYGFHVWSSASSYHAMTLWLRGFSDSAMAATQRGIAAAKAAGHSLSVVLVLAWPASMLLLDRGEAAAAERTIAELVDHAEEGRFVPYSGFAASAKGSLADAAGDPARAVELIRDGLATMQHSRYLMFYAFFLAEQAKAHARLEQYGESLDAIDAAIRRTIDSGALWLLPEALRIKGEILAMQPATADEIVEDLFAQSMSQAHRQGALHWQLRTAISLVEFRRARCRSEDACGVLRSLYGRFCEGLATPHLRRARALLQLPT